jgi:hypothetical protein
VAEGQSGIYDGRRRGVQSRDICCTLVDLEDKHEGAYIERLKSYSTIDILRSHGIHLRLKPPAIPNQQLPSIDIEQPHLCQLDFLDYKL